jgi:type II secretion system protein C
METLFKKYFWVLTLATLSGTAYLTAKGGMEYAAGAFLDDDSTLKMQPASRGNQGLYARANPNVLSQNLTERSPFNIERGPDEVSEKADCENNCENKECGSDGCGGSCGTCTDEQKCSSEGKCESADDTPQPSELNIELVGTMVHPVDHTLRFANIMVAGGNALMVTVGSEISGVGGSTTPTVIDILPKVIYLREADRITHIGLWDERGKGGASRPRAGRPSPRIGKRPSPRNSNSSRPGGRSSYDYSKGVKKISEFEFNIDRQMLDEQLTDLTQLGMQARVIPNYRGGKYEGFKLVGVKPGSLYRAIGIRSGDVIKAINGESINSPNKAMELFHQLKTSAEVSLEIERRRKTETFKYTIQ